MKQTKDVIQYPLIEVGDNEADGWSKMTVNYVLNNQGKIKKTILGTARRYLKNVQNCDVEDMLDKVIEYLYKAEDYDISKAVDKSKSGEVTSLEGYVGSCVKFCTIRACRDINDRARHNVSETIIGDDGSELSIFDSIADTRSAEGLDDFDYDLRTICENCEPIRYRYGPDIYLVWFVRLVTLHNKCPGKFNGALELLDIPEKEVLKLKEDYENNMMMSIAKAVSLSGIEESIDILRDYVFSAKSIYEAISQM